MSDAIGRHRFRRAAEFHRSFIYRRRRRALEPVRAATGARLRNTTHVAQRHKRARQNPHG